MSSDQLRDCSLYLHTNISHPENLRCGYNINIIRMSRFTVETVHLLHYADGMTSTPTARMAPYTSETRLGNVGGNSDH